MPFEFLGTYRESKPFRIFYDAGDLAAGEIKRYDNKTDPEKKHFIPFNIIRIINLSSQDILITFDDHYPFLVPANSTRNIEDFYFANFTVENLDTASANDGKIEIIYKAELTEKELLKLIIKYALKINIDEKR